MNILLLTATYIPSINGVSISIKSLFDNLNKLGHNVTVLAPANSACSGNEDGVIRYPAISNPKISDYPIPLLPLTPKIYGKLSAQKFDIIHAHHPFHIAFFANLLSKSRGCPFVFTYHTRYDEYAKIYLKFLPKRFREDIVGFTTNYTCVKSDLVITPSRTIETKLRSQFPYLQFQTIPTGLGDFSIPSKSKRLLRQELGFPKDKIILLSLSRLSVEKNIELLIRSVKKLPEQFCLLVVGSGPQEAHLKDLVKLLDLEKRVFFIGKVPHRDVSKYYKLSDIFLFPSITETQGITLLEALYFGLPVVAVKSDISMEWIPKGVGVHTKNSPADFSLGVRAVASMLSDKSVSKKAKTWARRYTAESSAIKTIIAYKDLIERKRRTDELTKTGWQSWSVSKNSLLKIPARNFSPKEDTTLIPKGSLCSSPKNRIKGWCSWYAFYTDINEQRITRQAKFIAENRTVFPLDYILIDDGWTLWGDWDKPFNHKFPHGMRGLSESIKELGLYSGIWLAPFLVDPKSNLARAHPDWLVNDFGRFVEGFRIVPLMDLVMPYKKFILDIKNPAAVGYINRVIDDLVLRSGYNLLKLDFLYAPHFDPSIKSPKEANWYIREFLIHVKKRHPNVHVIGSGLPLVSAVGVVDSMRIGPDTIDPLLDRKPVIGRVVNTIKVRRAIRVINARMWTHIYWNIDPDVFVCRESLGIADKHILSLQRAITRSKGNIFLGDDLSQLPSMRVERFIRPLFD